MSAPVFDESSTSGLRRYRLIAEIGHGGMADVFLAVMQGPAGFNKLVVIKKTRSELAADPDFLAMFLDEARLAARLNHPNVVQTHEIGVDGSRYFIAMEYLDGQAYSRIVSRLGTRLEMRYHLRVLADTLGGLEHAHTLADFGGAALCVVHRDATPQNVFVTYDGSIKVVDFGIAKAVDSSALTREGVVKGKISYMAPEQARGERVDARTDVFAVGVMLWEAIAGHRMWEGLPEITVVHELLHGQIPSIRQAAPNVPDALATIVERAIQYDANYRYASAIEMQQDIEHYLHATGQHASARDVGLAVADAFAEDRKRVKAIIEQQLKDVRWNDRQTGTELPRIGPAGAPSGGSRPGVTGSGGSQGGAQALTPPMTGSQSLATDGGASVPRSLPLPPNRRGLLVSIGVAAAAAVLGGGLAIRLLMSPPAPAAAAVASATPSATEAAAAPASPAPADQESVHIAIRVTPPDAKIYLDGVLLAAGSFDDKVHRSDKTRKLRVEAPHFVTKERPIVLNGDKDFDVSLERDPNDKPAAGAPPAAAPAGRPRRGGAAPEHPGPGGKKPTRSIDSDSPYGQP